MVIDIVSRMRPETFRAAVAAITRYDGRAILAKMNIPVLAIAGALDRTAPAEVMEKMAGKISGAEFVNMPDVGHFGWAEDAATFNRHLLDFLRRRCV